MAKDIRLRKDAQLQHWRGMAENQPMLCHFDPIPYKSEGSSYGACGIRIDGTPEFIDAVLSHLKELVGAEGVGTRLELARSKVEARPGRALNKAVDRAEVCYIRRHERGAEGQIYQDIVQNGFGVSSANRLATAERMLATV